MNDLTPTIIASITGFASMASFVMYTLIHLLHQHRLNQHDLQANSVRLDSTRG